MMGYFGTMPIGGSTRNFKKKKIGRGAKIAPPTAKNTKVNKPQMKSLSNQMKTKRKRTNFPEFCHLSLRRALRSSGVRKRPWLPTGIKTVDISLLYTIKRKGAM